MSLSAAGAGVAAAFAVIGLSAQGAVADTGISDKVASQIAALQKVKTSLSPAERKVDSRLVVTLRRRAGATRIPRAVPGAPVSKAGTALVDVRAGKAGPDLLKRLQREGARIVSASGGTVRARIPLSALKTVASWSGVRRVGVAAEWMTHEIVSEGDVSARCRAASARR